MSCFYYEGLLINRIKNGDIELLLSQLDVLIPDAGCAMSGSLP